LVTDLERVMTTITDARAFQAAKVVNLVMMPEGAIPPTTPQMGKDAQEMTFIVDVTPVDSMPIK